MVSISHWVQLTLPGRIELPGSFYGEMKASLALRRDGVNSPCDEQTQADA
ncbi:hypothetical protein [Novosphingobium sp. M1R2S20]|uniref:Uncharacterized protein n=1 Tax=Novosphingobium rhizovicinum TaxID=3228928 RepID=A0ABV3RAQ6_9SPHN